MPKVGAKCGMTLRLFRDSQYEFIRPEISIDEIDTEGDIRAQLDSAVKALKEVWDETTNQVSELVIAQMPQTSKELELQVGKKLQVFEKRIGDLEKQLKKSGGKD